MNIKNQEVQDARNIQKRLFFDVLNRLNYQNLKTDFLLNLLDLKKTSLYNRINGEKLLTLDEFNLLLTTFDLNPKKYFNKNSTHIEVNFPFLFSKISSKKEFVQGILRRLMLAARLPDAQMFYISSEIPVLNYFRYRELALFKLYIYGKTVWEIPELKKQQF